MSKTVDLIAEVLTELGEYVREAARLAEKQVPPRPLADDHPLAEAVARLAAAYPSGGLDHEGAHLWKNVVKSSRRKSWPLAEAAGHFELWLEAERDRLSAAE